MIARPALRGEHLVDVRLMAHVEDEFVLGRVEDAVQRDGQLHHAEVRPEMAADAVRVRLAHHVDQLLADLLRELRQVALGQRLQVGGRLDFVEQAHAAVRRWAAPGRQTGSEEADFMVDSWSGGRWVPRRAAGPGRASLPWVEEARADPPRTAGYSDDLRLAGGVAGDDLDALFGGAQPLGADLARAGCLPRSSGSVPPAAAGSFPSARRAFPGVPSRSRNSGSARRRERVHGRAWDGRISGEKRGERGNRGPAETRSLPQVRRKGQVPAVIRAVPAGSGGRHERHWAVVLPDSGADPAVGGRCRRYSSGRRGSRYPCWKGNNGRSVRPKISAG